MKLEKNSLEIKVGAEIRHEDDVFTVEAVTPDKAEYYCTRLDGDFVKVYASDIDMRPYVEEYEG